MKHSLKAFLITLVVFNIALAGTASAKACTMPCCAHARKDDCKDGAPAGISAAKGACCSVKSGGSLPEASSVTAVPFHAPDTAQYALSPAAHVYALVIVAPERLRPGPSLNFSSPPIYTLTSSYLC